MVLVCDEWGGRCERRSEHKNLNLRRFFARSSGSEFWFYGRFVRHRYPWLELGIIETILASGISKMHDIKRNIDNLHMCHRYVN